jgi:hypothetical protein
LPTFIKVRAVARLISDATHGNHQPEPHRFEWLRLQQAGNRSIANADRREENQEALEGTGEILGLAVAVSVIFVCGERCQCQHPQRHQCASQVHERFDGVGQ